MTIVNVCRCLRVRGSLASPHLEGTWAVILHARGRGQPAPSGWIARTLRRVRTSHLHCAVNDVYSPSAVRHSSHAGRCSSQSKGWLRAHDVGRAGDIVRKHPMSGAAWRLRLFFWGIMVIMIAPIFGPISGMIPTSSPGRALLYQLAVGHSPRGELVDLRHANRKGP